MIVCWDLKKGIWEEVRRASVQFSSVQSLSRVWLFATPWIAARQASLSITNSQSSLKLMSIESVMPSSHLILCHPLLLLPPVPPSIRALTSVHIELETDSETDSQRKRHERDEWDLENWRTHIQRENIWKSKKIFPTVPLSEVLEWWLKMYLLFFHSISFPLCFSCCHYATMLNLVS